MVLGKLYMSFQDMCPATVTREAEDPGDILQYREVIL
jgi:hypothetical protein